MHWWPTSASLRISGYPVVLLFALTLSAQQGGVRGTVSGPDGPLSDATIRVWSGGAQSGQTLSGPTGAFQLPAPVGEIAVTVSKPGMTESRTETTLEADFEMRVRLDRLIPLTGSVRDSTGALVAADIAVRALRGEHTYRIAAPAGTFLIEAPAAPVVVEAVPRDGRLRPARRNFDLTAQNSGAVAIIVSPDAPPLLSAAPPVAERIVVTEPDARGMARVRGSAGAVDPLSAVFVANLSTEQCSFGVSSADGSFDVAMFAPPGSFILIRHDPAARYLSPRSDIGAGFGAAKEGPAGTIVRTPDHAVPPDQIAVNLMTIIDPSVQEDPREYPNGAIHDAGQLWLSGSMPKRHYQPGDIVRMTGRVTIFSRDLTETTDLAAIRIDMNPGGPSLRRMFVGERYVPDKDNVTAWLTPSGFPIQMPALRADGKATFSHTPLQRAGPHILQGDWTLQYTIPPASQAGIYLPQALPIVRGMPPHGRHIDALPTFRGRSQPYPFPYVTIGVPQPRIPWIAAFDEAASGLRGTLTAEDRARFAIMNNIRFNGDTFVIRPADPHSGLPAKFRLEPYLPISFAAGGIPSPPDVPLKFPSGSLSVSVVRPDGVREELGTAPFRQYAFRVPLTRNGYPSHGLSAHIGDVAQLTTLDPRFEYTFPRSGVYTVIMSGTVEDIHGTVYRGGGEYTITVARHLDLETAILAGTPFETGDRGSLAVVVQPPVPAEVNVRVRSWSDTALVAEKRVSGRANRFGVFIPSESFAFHTAGEYRVDVDVRHVDPDGTLWAGGTAWGSVVETPGSPLVARGRRGFDCMNVVQERWFEAETHRGCDHVMFPFDRGDVLWLRDTRPHGQAAIPAMSIQDTTGAFAALLRRHHPHCCFDLPFETRQSVGELPLLSSTDSVASPHDPLTFGYFYALSERPGVHVRQMVTDDQSGGNGYWRFSDYYDFQPSNGFLGDLPNDFKFNFGGAVYRSPRDSFFYYGAYASLLVIIPDDDPHGNRLMPPFRGNGGGPDAGPLMQLKGKPIDIFFHPTAVRPGTILWRGDRLSFAGYSAPPLPSKIRIDWISPTGHNGTISGQANKSGFFFSPEGDVILEESGVWRAKVQIVFDGFMSAGQVTPPFPTGSVLGSSDGEMEFYVVDSDSPPLQVTASSATLTTSPTGIRLVRPADGPITFTITPPSGLTNVELHTTSTMPGFILEQTDTTLGSSDTSLTYVYDARRLARDFPNLDLHDADGFAGADTITISFFVAGTDAVGTRRHFARQIVIQGEELLMPDQNPPPSRRRAVRS